MDLVTAALPLIVDPLLSSPKKSSRNLRCNSGPGVKVGPVGSGRPRVVWPGA